MVNEDVKRSEWDSREKYAVQLHEYNSYANELKSMMELREGDLLKILNRYCSALKTIYREIKPFIAPGKILDNRKKEKKITKGTQIWYDNQFMIIGMMLDQIKRRNPAGFVQKTGRIIIPQDLEDRLEAIHNALNKARFDHGLIVPTRTDPKSIDELI